LNAPGNWCSSSAPHTVARIVVLQEVRMSTAGAVNVEDLEAHDHACWVSVPGEQHRDRLTRYLSAGLARGERVGFFGAPVDRVEAVTADLADAGVPVTELVAGGRLVLGSAEEQYLHNGAFDPERRLHDYATAVRGALHDGFRGLRVAADVAWLAAHPQARVAWPGYEFGADVLAARLPFTALCMYDPRQWQTPELALLASLHARRVDHQSPEGDTGFRVAAERNGSIRLIGELDLTDAARFGDIIDVAVRYNGVTALDVSALRFVDVAGMRMIAATCAEMIRNRGEATIWGTSSTFRRFWRLAMFDAAAPAIRME
jgi:anti-anti-sigma factor